LFTIATSLIHAPTKSSTTATINTERIETVLYSQTVKKKAGTKMALPQLEAKLISNKEQLKALVSLV